MRIFVGLLILGGTGFCLVMLLIALFLNEGGKP
jgi:hypothetical protein